MRIILPSGSPAEMCVSASSPTMGLVIAPDIFGLRPLYDDLVARLAAEWSMGVCAVEPFPGRDLSADIGPRSAAVASCHKASRSDRFDRIVSFYGMIRVPEAWRSPTQGEPLEHLAANAGRVLAIIGELDPYTPPADVDALEAKGVNVARFPEAEHGFAHDPARPAHRPGDAAEAFRLAREWLTG
ncbi:MAG: putative Carboxymethylenebutenolidase [Acidimicrobiaceae bacterium]|nr:MAG: putative Carboxymethylenebutenolidase [Acidimicrobiaceae bacterium]